MKIKMKKRLGPRATNAAAENLLLIIIVGVMLVLYFVWSGLPKPFDFETTNSSNSLVRVQVFFDDEIVIDEILQASQSYREEFDVDAKVTVTIVLDNGVEQTAPSTWGMDDELNVRINPDKSLTYTDGDGNILTA